MMYLCVCVLVCRREIGSFVAKKGIKLDSLYNYWKNN